MEGYLTLCNGERGSPYIYARCVVAEELQQLAGAITLLAATGANKRNKNIELRRQYQRLLDACCNKDYDSIIENFIYQ